MTRFLTLLTFITALLAPAFLGAQQAREDLDDRGYIQAFLEDNLSDLGRDIRIIGFAGALSSQATIDQITIADEEGVWLVLNGVVLSWSRAALLSGRIDIDTLSAEEILLPRRPIPVGGVPAPEASGFALPELPVSVDIAEIRAGRVVLGEPVLGTAATVELTGEAYLNGAAGSANVTITRTDGPNGKLALKGAYNNVDTMLDLALELEESAGGIAANLLDLPGRPSTDLRVIGAGPLRDFKADIALSTDGKKRLAGQVSLTGGAPNAAADTVPVQRFRAALSGDIAPVFLPEYRDFFGDQIALTAAGLRQENGAFELSELELSTAVVSLSGQLSLSAGGWPEKFALKGQLSDPEGRPVLLPLSGVKTEVKGADVSISYDHSSGDMWQAEAQLSKLAREDVTIEQAKIVASGNLLRGEGTAVGHVGGTMTLSTRGITPLDAKLAEAIGSELTGDLRFQWTEDAPLSVSDIVLSGENYRLVGGLKASDLSTGITVKTENKLSLSADDLSRFAPLIGVDLNGAAKVDLVGTVNLLGGAFDLQVGGLGRELSLNQPQLDPLLKGESTLDFSVVRDEAGTRIPEFLIRTTAAEAILSADLRTEATRGDFDVRIFETSRIEPGLKGAATLTGTLRQTGEVWTLTVDGTAPGESQFSASGILQFAEGKPDTLKGDIQAKMASLSPYAGLTGQRISGALDFTALGEMRLADGQFNASIDGRGQNLAIGQPALDPLIAGKSTLSAEFHRGADTPILLDALELTTKEARLTATGQSDGTTNRLKFSGSLRDLGVVADGVNGPAQANGTAVLLGNVWKVSVKAKGPAEANINLNGDVRADGSRADVKIDGSAHLALLNPLIRPRLLSGQATLDLALNGPLKLASLSGSVRVPSGRLVLPTRRLAFDLNRGNMTLLAGSAQVDVAASVPEGGQITIAGPINLSAPYDGNLEILARGLHLSDGNLFQTIIDGVARLRGPLKGGARLVADLTLGPTEIRVPEAAPSSVPIMEGLEHVSEPAAVRRTRRFAGLIVDRGTAGPTLAYPIDVRLNAPGQIFVRGRGLDAELGGGVRLTGTNTNIVPQGQFNLVRGRLDILGKRLSLTEGQVNLQGGFDPFLHFKAESEAEDTQVFIGVDGPASAPEISFTSNPERPQDEVLALLLFGRSITEISAVQALRMAAAVRVLAGKGGEGIVSKLRGSFGLDDLDIGLDADGVATVKAGKYISENVYTDVTIGSDGTSEINLNLNLTPSLTARGGVGSDGESKLGIFFERDY